MCLNGVSASVPLPYKARLQNRDLGRRANQISIYGGSNLRIATSIFILSLQSLPLLITRSKSVSQRLIVFRFCYMPSHWQAFAGQIPALQRSCIGTRLGTGNLEGGATG